MDGSRRNAKFVLVILCASLLLNPQVSDAEAERHRGYYIFGHEVRTFQPCGSDTVFWVKAEADISKQLREAHQKFTSKPYEPVYVEVTGYFADKATAGFAAEYEGQIVIESINLVRIKSENDCSPVAGAEGGITGIVWKWQQTLLGDGQNAVPDDPDRYTVAFEPGGKLYVRADCNRVGGNYSIDDSSLTIETTYSTRAMCPPDSLEQTFLKHLNAAAIHFIRQGALFIDLQADSGTMEFSK